MTFRTVDVGEVYIESNIMYSNTYTCAPLENPITAHPSNQIHEQQNQLQHSKAPGLPFHLCRISLGGGFGECWGEHHLVRL
jgi:hypothetical protein